MMRAADWNGVLVADLSTKRAGLGKAPGLAKRMSCASAGGQLRTTQGVHHKFAALLVT
jgi:hypothetical protein